MLINPYAKCSGAGLRYGQVSGVGDLDSARELEDEVSDHLSTCDLLVNASVNITTGYYLSSLAGSAGRPIVALRPPPVV